MTEERIKELLRPIIAQLFEWSVKVRRPSYGTIAGFVQSTFKSALYTVAAESRKEVVDELRDALTIRCCHVTGMHDPTHYEKKKYVCSIQRAEAFDRAREVCGMEEPFPEEAIPKENCGWCKIAAERLKEQGK